MVRCAGVLSLSHALELDPYDGATRARFPLFFLNKYMTTIAMVILQLRGNFRKPLAPDKAKEALQGPLGKGILQASANGKAQGEYDDVAAQTVELAVDRLLQVQLSARLRKVLTGGPTFEQQS